MVSHGHCTVRNLKSKSTYILLHHQTQNRIWWSDKIIRLPATSFRGHSICTQLSQKTLKYCAHSLHPTITRATQDNGSSHREKFIVVAVGLPELLHLWPQQQTNQQLIKIRTKLLKLTDKYSNKPNSTLSILLYI